MRDRSGMQAARPTGVDGDGLEDTEGEESRYSMLDPRSSLAV
jgi:hypothetical protein